MNASTPQNREELIRELFENMTAMKRGIQNHIHNSPNALPIPRAQLELLFTVEHLQPASVKQLALQLHLTPGAVSQLAEALVHSNYLARQTDQADRRIQFLTLTPRGIDATHTIKKQRTELMSTVMKELTDEELAVWLKVQRKMINHFKTTARTENQEK